MTQEIGYTIRAMAARCGMTPHTLRYYERIGLLQQVGRQRNGHRRYSAADEGWLKFLKCMRSIHMPLREIQRYAAIRNQGPQSEGEGRKVLEDHRRALEQQIAQLQKAHEVLLHNLTNGSMIGDQDVPVSMAPLPAYPEDMRVCS